jgi:hypothetical protein
MIRAPFYNSLKLIALPTALLFGILVVQSPAAITHRYSFTSDATDSVGSANGTLVNVATVAGGQLQLNNAPFTGPGTAGGYLSLPPSILPTSGSVTIEQWFTFGGSGFFTEAYTFSDNNNDTAGPGANNGQYLMHTISAPQGGPVPAGGGSHVGQALSGYAGSLTPPPGGETDAFGTTPGIGAGGGGYLDDGGTYMAATVIDGGAGTLSYYLYRVSDSLGGLQQSITAIPLSSYAFTNAYLGRSAFAGDNSTNGSVDEFRIYNNAKSAAEILADLNAGPNVVVPEPSTFVLSAIAFMAMGCVMTRRRKK